MTKDSVDSIHQFVNDYTCKKIETAPTAIAAKTKTAAHSSDEERQV